MKPRPLPRNGLNRAVSEYRFFLAIAAVVLLTLVTSCRRCHHEVARHRKFWFNQKASLWQWEQRSRLPWWRQTRRRFKRTPSTISGVRMA